MTDDPLQACLDEIDASGATSFRTRMRLMASFGPYTHQPGRRVRAFLSILCAERTLHFWQHRHGDDAVVEGLHACRRFLDGAIGADAFRRLFHSAHAAAEDFDYEVPGLDDSVLCAGFSATNAMAVCLGDDAPLGGDSESDVDVGDWDSAFHSVVAVAGGADWQEHALDLEARAAFWRWWAVEAVPQAMRLADGPPVDRA